MNFIKKLLDLLSRLWISNKLKPTIYTADQHLIEAKSIQSAARKIANRLQNAGFTAYVVGGAIRDILLNQHPKDFDIVTNAKPEQIKPLFKKERAIIIGRRFKIVHVTIGTHTLEVSTFRSSKQGTMDQDGMRINDNAYGRIEEDVLRRDFTINGLYFDPISLEMYDFINSKQDITNKIIKVIGTPEKRFIEDPVRMLRAARLAAKLNFQISEDCLDAIAKNKNSLAKVSSDRLSLEIQKLFYGGYGQKSLEKLYSLSLFSVLFPQTQSCIENPKISKQVKLLLSQSMYNADRRFKSGKSLSTAFLFATLLWWPLKERLRALNHRDKDYSKKYLEACQAVINTQQSTLRIPKKIADGVIAIWNFQYTFSKGDTYDVERILRAPRFRASLDLLVLRAHVNEPVWWQAAKWSNLSNEQTA